MLIGEACDHRHQTLFWLNMNGAVVVAVRCYNSMNGATLSMNKLMRVLS
ncbi:MAG: hypothetical protein KAX40_05035 [Herpetosiphon sp.]|nr:hypothetical protein [Herpetosiphon sp.]